MNQLNDDCVCHILEYLPLVDQIKMARLAERFQNLLCLIVWRNPRYRKVSISDSMLKPLTKVDYIYFFELTSGTMEELYISDVYRKTFDSYLGRHLLRPELAFYLRSDFSNLRKLCILDSNMNNSMIHTLVKNCGELTSLSVSSAYITGKHMIGFKKLDTLVARECSIEPYYLRELLGTRQLYYLDLTCNRYQVEKIILETSGSKHLDRLGLSSAQDYGFHLVQHLPQLTLLIISYHEIKPEEQLEMLDGARKLVESSNCKEFPQRLQSILCNVVDVEVALELITGLETRQPRESPKYCELLTIRYRLFKPEANPKNLI